MQFAVPPSDTGPGYVGEVNDVPDTPENRAWVEQYAIPKCQQNRMDNGTNGVPALYCVSAYCARCTVMRDWDGVAPVLPNAWLYV